MPQDFSLISYDPDFTHGARSAVFTCLRVQKGERAVVIADRQSLPIAAAIHEQLRAADAEVDGFLLEDEAERPLSEFPERIARSLEKAQVSVFTAEAAPGELRIRIAMTDIVNRHGIRHAHMVNITPRIMREGMRADFSQVDALSRWVMDKVRDAKEMTATTPAGTDLTAQLSSDLKWIKTSGIISREKWGNLPGGEVFTSPARVDGVYVVDAVLGDWLAPKHGNMLEHPLTVRIENSRIKDVSCERQEIVDDFLSYTSTDENSNRVGELALGTNLAVNDVIGQILQDEKIPGLHLAFGHPYTEHTGADWRSSTHIDIVGRNFDVAVDGKPIMKNSRFLVDYDSFGS